MTDGNFAGVPHEMIEKLMSTDLSPKEWRLIWFFIRYLQGYQMKERVIKTDFIIEKTGLAKQRVIEALTCLVKKGIIDRNRWSSWEPGRYVYSWNDKFFERTHATKEIRVDPKVTDLMTYKKKVTESVTLKSGKPDLEITCQGPEKRNIHSGNTDFEDRITGLTSPDNRTPKPQETAPRAHLGAPKDTNKQKKNILKKEEIFDNFNRERERERDREQEWNTVPDKVREMFPQFFRQQ